MFPRFSVFDYIDQIDGFEYWMKEPLTTKNISKEAEGHHSQWWSIV